MASPSTTSAVPALDPLNPAQSDAFAADPAFNHGKRIGILVVTYNALTTISKVLKRIPPNVWNNVEEVAVFDDASKDETFELAVGLRALQESPKLQVLKHPKNLGYGGNQKAGYRYFLEKNFDVVVLLHGDGQYAPEVLASMYQPIVTGKADAVFGSRMMKRADPLKGGMPLYKYVGNRILTRLENSALSMDLTEFHSGYRAYSLHALAQINFDYMTDDFHFDTEIIIKLNHQGFRISEVPIPTYYGTEICHVNGMKYAWDVLRAVRRYNRTRRSYAKYPEFQEYFVRYPVKTSPHSSHEFARKAVGTGGDVLDVGCGEGFLAAALQKAGNRVHGVDFLPAAKHAPGMEGYDQVDLDGHFRYGAGIVSGRMFDAILLLDVLEHLQRPENLLRECLPLLRPDGLLLISVPNIANITVRLMLLMGRFEYAERGLLDRTHLRFFTRRSARRLLTENGYEILRQKMTVIPLDLAIGVSSDHALIRFLQRVLAGMTVLLPGLLGYQSFLIARRSR
jgi:2-polyprenyl-3-methyl-5-hydroxy-6-metoxy-1,4-benzoquinol methylase